MQDEDKLLEAQKGLRVFLRQFSPRDRVGLFTFSERVHEIISVDVMRLNLVPLQTAVDNLVPGGVRPSTTRRRVVSTRSPH